MKPNHNSPAIKTSTVPSGHPAGALGQGSAHSPEATEAETSLAPHSADNPGTTAPSQAPPTPH